MAARIGVTGPKGRLGSELVRRGCIPIYCDVTDQGWLRDTLERAALDVVVHCAAMTEVDACESQPERAARINTLGTWNLAQVFTGPIVYLSTDYIFDGQDGPYGEDAPANPISVYGWTKLGGELAVRKRRNERDLVVRTTVLFDCYSTNFVTAVTRKLLAGEELDLPDDLVGSPTYVPDLARGILAAIDREVGGVLNLVGSRTLCRWALGYEIVKLLRITSPETRVRPLKYAGVTPRPLNAGLYTARARELGLPIGDPVEGIKEVIAYVRSVIA